MGEDQDLGQLADGNASSDMLDLGPESTLAPDSIPPMPDQDAGDDAASAAEPEAKPEAQSETPSHERVEALLSGGDYQGLVDLIGPVTRASRMPPFFALVFALSHKELELVDDRNVVNRLAIKSVAGLLDLAPDSPAATILAKRLLRSKAGWRQRQAPEAPARVAIIVIGIALGIIGGWMAGPGSVQIVEVIKTITR